MERAERALTIIPLGRGSRHGSSSLPEGCSPAEIALPRRKRCKLSLASLGEPGRLSPPIWPCTTRGFPCLACCQTSGGLLPHRFTLTSKSAFERRWTGFPAARHRSPLCGGLFSVALSVTQSRAELSFGFATASPGVTRRVAPLSADADRCPDFPPAAFVHLATDSGPAGDHPAHPPRVIITHLIAPYSRDARAQPAGGPSWRNITRASTKPSRGC